ncbi:hypothetical protein ACKAV7_004826 [Fusarium commune]
MDVSSSPTKENESPVDVDTKPATTPTRYSTLSWQRRPNSRSGSARVAHARQPKMRPSGRSLGRRSLPQLQLQPLSRLSEGPDAMPLDPKNLHGFARQPTVGLISCLPKEPSRGYDRLDMASVKAQLPGMTTEQPKPSPPAEEPVKEPAKEPATPSKMRLASSTLHPPALDAGEDKSVGDRFGSMSGRVAPTRSTSRSNSPTKGMGGFVQSAMMKRSDSVKRWALRALLV